MGFIHAPQNCEDTRPRETNLPDKCESDKCERARTVFYVRLYEDDQSFPPQVCGAASGVAVCSRGMYFLQTRVMLPSQKVTVRFV